MNTYGGNGVFDSILISRTVDFKPKTVVPTINSDIITVYQNTAKIYYMPLLDNFYIVAIYGTYCIKDGIYNPGTILINNTNLPFQLEGGIFLTLKNDSYDKTYTDTKELILLTWNTDNTISIPRNHQYNVQFKWPEGRSWCRIDTTVLCKAK